MNNDDWERLRNFSLFKIWATDKEMEEMFPYIAIVGVIVIGIFFIFAFLG